MNDRDAFEAELQEVQDAAAHAGAARERTKRHRGRLAWIAGTIVAVALASGFIRNYLAIEAGQAVDAAVQSEVDNNQQQQDEALEAQAMKVEEFLATQQAAGVPITAADLKQALASVQTSDPSLQALLAAITDKLEELEQSAAAQPPAGPSGPSGASGAPYTGPPPEDGEDGEDGDDASPPQISFAIVDGNMFVTINGATLDLGPVVVPGPQGRGVLSTICVDGTWQVTYYDPATGQSTVEPGGPCWAPSAPPTTDPTEPTTSDPEPTTTAAPTT